MPASGLLAWRHDAFDMAEPSNMKIALIEIPHTTEFHDRKSLTRVLSRSEPRLTVYISDVDDHPYVVL